MSTFTTKSTSELGVVTAIASVVSFAVVWRIYKSSQAKNLQTKKWLPYAPCGFMECVKNFSGKEAPFFLLRLARQMNRDSYRLPLPIGSQGAYVVADYDTAREIRKDIGTDKPLQIYRSFEGISGKRIMFTRSNGDVYMTKLRKGTAHAFSRNQVGRMNQIALKCVDEWMNDRLAMIADTNANFDPAYEMNHIIFRGICESAFEYQNLTVEDYEHFSHHIEIALREFTFKQSTNPFRHYLWKLLPGVREALASSEQCLVFTRKVLQNYKRKKITGEVSEEKTLIRLLYESIGDDDEQVAAEAISWLTAGHDTTGFSLSNALVLLAKYPYIQTKLRHELMSNKTECDYFQLFLRELSRFMPVAAMGSIRTTARDIPTKYGDIIPKGGVCFLPQYVVHHSQQVFGPTADEFDPERWVDATPAMLESIFTFSLGSRNCPGQSLAMAEIQSTLPRLLKQYEFFLVEEGTIDYFLTLKYFGAKLQAKKIQ